jgi:hypothetical protein
MLPAPFPNLAEYSELAPAAVSAYAMLQHSPPLN